MRLRGRSSLAPLAVALLLGGAACGGSEPPPAPPPPPPLASAETPPTPPAATEAPPPAADKPALPEVAFGPQTASDQPKKLPKVTISAPTAEQSIAKEKAKDFDVKLNVKDWETAPGSSHVHLILDNKPYKPIYDPKKPVKLSELVPAGEELAEGEHLLVAFPSRMNHESVKAPGALASVHFWVGKKGKSEWKAKDAFLIYSRPKGTYNASKADHVIVDWYLANAELGDGKDSLKATVKGPGLDEGGRSLTIKEWKPYVLENLRNGEYTISLELEDKDGKAVPGAWNSTTRTIVINRDAPEDAPPPAATAPEKDKDKDKKAAPGSEKGKDKADKGAGEKKDKPTKEEKK
jgi:hypothetical protein